jgi:hypothetical protein
MTKQSKITGGHSDALSAMLGPLGPKLVFSVSESGRFLGRSRKWLYDQMAVGHIRFVMLGPRRAIPRAELLRLASEGTA